MKSSSISINRQSLPLINITLYRPLSRKGDTEGFFCGHPEATSRSEEFSFFYHSTEMLRFSANDGLRPPWRTGIEPHIVLYVVARNTLHRYVVELEILRYAQDVMKDYCPSSSMLKTSSIVECRAFATL